MRTDFRVLIYIIILLNDLDLYIHCTSHVCMLPVHICAHAKLLREEKETENNYTHVHVNCNFLCIFYAVFSIKY